MQKGDKSMQKDESCVGHMNCPWGMFKGLSVTPWWVSKYLKLLLLEKILKLAKFSMVIFGYQKNLRKIS